MSDSCCNRSPCGSRKYSPPPAPVIPVTGVLSCDEAGCEGAARLFENVTAPLVIPEIDGVVSVPVCDASNWPVGLCVFISDGTRSAYLQIQSADIDDNVLYLLNTGSAGNVDGGTVLNGTIAVTAYGPCPDEATSSCDRMHWELGESFTIPGDGISAELVVEPCVEVADGQTLFVSGAGYFSVISTVSQNGTSTTLEVEFSRLLEGVEVGDVVPSGTYVIADELQAASGSVSASSFLVQNDNAGGSPGTSLVLASAEGFAFNTVTYDHLDASVGALGTSNGGTAFVAAADAIHLFTASLQLEAPDNVTDPAGANEIKEPQCVILRNRGGTVTVAGKGGGNQALSTDNILSATAHVKVLAGDKIFVGWYDTGSSVWAADSGWPLQSPTSTEFSYFSGHLVSLL